MRPPATVFDYRATTVEIRAGGPRIAILPIATIEQHGPHLPLATDWIIVDAVAREVAGRLGEPAYLLPTFPYGTSIGMKGFAGTAWLRAETLTRVARDVVAALRAQGIRRIIVVNAHGGPNEGSAQPRGNFIVKTAVRQLNYDHADLDVIWVQPLTAARQKLSEIFESARDDVHAGEVETSLLLRLRPALVKGRAADVVPALGREYLQLTDFARLCPSGVWGRPGLASADKGGRAFDAAVEATVSYAGESFANLRAAKGRDDEGAGAVVRSRSAGLVSIRSYRAADRGRIRSLTVEGFAGVAVEHAIEARWPGVSELTWGERKFMEVVADLEAHPETCFVADIERQVVGFITTEISEVKSQGHVRDLVVGREWRGEGIGRQLLSHALETFRRRGMKIARIETLSHNEVGAHLYPTLGFHLVATQNHYAMLLDE
ncbi:MAG: GNAT family N-acetyltransferase [Chloroflexota bacterium]